MRGFSGAFLVVGCLVLAAATLSGCTNRPLSMMDTWFGTNDHPHLVWVDNQVRYSDELQAERDAAEDEAEME
jgi:hypothetical protein